MSVLSATRSELRLADRAALLPVGAVLLALMSVALLARLALIFALKAWEHPNAMEHHSIAIFLLRGEGFTFSDWGVIQPTSVQSPPYPLFLASLYWLFDMNFTAAHKTAMIVNAVLGAISVGLTYLVVRTLRGTALAGLIAATLVAVWPTQVYATTVVQAISFITCCTLAVIWLFYRSVDTRCPWSWLAYGIIGCVGALTEPVMLPFMALSGLLILFWPGLEGSVRLRNAAILFVTALVVLGPWAYRNHLVHGQLIPVKSTFWVNMWKANNPNASGTDRLAMTDETRKALATLSTAAQRDPNIDVLRQYDLLTPVQRIELTGKTEIEREAVFAKYARSWIAENPAGYLKMCAIRLAKTLWIEWDNPKGTRVYLALRTLLIVLTLVGLVAAVRSGWRIAIPLLVVGVALLTYTLTIAAARFALPYEPWQLSLFACAAGALISGRRSTEPKPT
jgi:4-amino-4-deoxy-L-arabinose transferase-like glycosyltransferase